MPAKSHSSGGTSSLSIESLSNAPKNHQIPASCSLSGKKPKKSPSDKNGSVLKNKKKSSLDSSPGSLEKKRSSSQSSVKRKAGKVSKDDSSLEVYRYAKKFEDNRNEMMSEYMELTVPERNSSSLDKCALLLANILGEEASDVIMNSTSLSEDDLHHKQSTVKKVAQLREQFGDVEVDDSSNMLSAFRAKATSQSSTNVKRASKLEEKLKRSGCYANNTLSGESSQHYGKVTQEVLNSTEISKHRNPPSFDFSSGGMYNSGPFSKQLRHIMQQRGAFSDQQSPIKHSQNAVESSDLSSMSQILLTPQHEKGPLNAYIRSTGAPQESYDNTLYPRTSMSHYQNESLMCSESLATSTPRHNRSLAEDKSESKEDNFDTTVADVLTKELEVASNSFEPSNSASKSNEKQNGQGSYVSDDDDASTVLLLKTLNEDKSLTLEQKLSLIATAGQISMQNASTKASTIKDKDTSSKESTNDQRDGNAVGSKGDANKLLRDTLSKLSMETTPKDSAKPSGDNLGKSAKHTTTTVRSPSAKIVNQTLLDSDTLRQRKLETIKDQLGVVNDIFSDLKSVASRRNDRELQQAVQELEGAVSVLPSIVDKKIFDNELKFTVQPLQEKVVLLEGELAQSKARVEAMEKLHKESLEAKQKEMSILKENFNQQMATEKLQCNKLRSAKASVEKDNEKLEDEVRRLREQLKCQRNKLEDCSSGFSDEIKEIRAEITSALTEVQRQKSKLAMADRQNQELQWSIEAKNEETKTFEDLAKKQHESMSELMKELSIARSSLHQQKSLASTLAHEVATLKSERYKFATEAAKIRQSFLSGADASQCAVGFNQKTVHVNAIKPTSTGETQTTPTSSAPKQSRSGNSAENASKYDGQQHFMVGMDHEYVIAHASNINFNQHNTGVHQTAAVSDRHPEQVISVETPASNFASITMETSSDTLQPFSNVMASDNRQIANNVPSQPSANQLFGNLNVETDHGGNGAENPASCRSQLSSTSSRLSDVKNFDLSFDTNSYSNFHIPSDDNTPRNSATSHSGRARNALADNMESFAGNSNSSSAESDQVNGPDFSQFPPYLSEQYINAVNLAMFNHQNQYQMSVEQSSNQMYNGVSYSNGCLPYMNPAMLGCNVQQFKAYSVSLPSSELLPETVSSGIYSNGDVAYNESKSLSKLQTPYSKSVPLLDFSSLSNTSSAIPSAKSESKFQEGIKMLDADIQKLQNSIQQLFAVGNRE